MTSLETLSPPKPDSEIAKPEAPVETEQSSDEAQESAHRESLFGQPISEAAKETLLEVDFKLDAINPDIISICICFISETDDPAVYSNSSGGYYLFALATWSETSPWHQFLYSFCHLRISIL